MGDLRESEPKERSLQVDVGCDLMRESTKKVSNATTGMGCWYVSSGRGEGRHRDDVRDNTTTKGTHTSPKGRPRDQNWSHFEVGLRSAAAFCGGGLNELAHNSTYLAY